MTEPHSFIVAKEGEPLLAIPEEEHGHDVVRYSTGAREFAAGPLTEIV